MADSPKTFAEGKPLKSVVLGILFRRTRNGIEVLTQLRIIKTAGYDLFYDRTWEVMGETMARKGDTLNHKTGEKSDKDETPIDSLLRGVEEECGVKNFTPDRIYGTTEWTWSTGKGDVILCYEPLCLVFQKRGPHPWWGPAFAVQVPASFVAKPTEGDGEAAEPRWLPPHEVLNEMSTQPERYMGLHMPALERFCIKATQGHFD